MLTADAVFDPPDGPEISFEGLVVASNPAHRWVYCSNITRDEVWVFVNNDSCPENPHSVPHVAFDDSMCPPGGEPHASIEIRGTAYWY